MAEHSEIRGRIWLGAIALAAGITVLLAILFVHLPELEQALSIDEKMPWENKAGVVLRSGPSWFVYDKAEKVLRTGRPIGDAAKRDLLGLLGDQRDATYYEAVDSLAYKSNQSAGSARIMKLILVLGILSGILGVLIRSVSSFVFHACFLKDLNLSIWWPWYILRPFLGAAVGVTLIVLLKSRLLNLSEPEQFSGYWLLGVCILAGFGIDEFVNRLFYLARTLFGESSDETSKSTNANG